MTEPAQKEHVQSVEELVEQAAAALRWAAWRGFSHVEIESLEPPAPQSMSRPAVAHAIASATERRQTPTITSNHTESALQSQSTSTPEIISLASAHGRQCPHCRPWLTAAEAAAGATRPSPQVMVLVDAPMEINARGQRRLTGDGGALLSKMFEAIGLSGDQVYLSASYHCFASDTESAEPSAQDHQEFVRLELEALQPKVLLVMGDAAAKRALNKPLQEVIGWWERVSHVHATATWDPASLLEQPDRKRQAWEDLKQLRKRLGQGTSN